MRHSVDFEQTPRAVVALADEYPAGFVDPCHSHRRAQLLYASSGVMSVITDAGTFVVPPQRAVWLPAGTEHEVSCRGPVSLRTLYIEPIKAAGLPAKPCVLEVSDLLRALIMEAMRLKPEYDLEGRGGRIVDLSLDEIGALPVADLYTPMPMDRRLLRVCRAILENPANDADLDSLASMAGMSRRTLTRAFREETGMSVAAWRQHVRLLEALSLLAVGKPVTTVAFIVGYDSASSFTAMFHKVFGVSPSQYFAQYAENPVRADLARTN
jgi:AraC-like DNA-binding protein